MNENNVLNEYISLWVNASNISMEVLKNEMTNGIYSKYVQLFITNMNEINNSRHEDNARWLYHISMLEVYLLEICKIHSKNYEPEIILGKVHYGITNISDETIYFGIIEDMKHAYLFID